MNFDVLRQKILEKAIRGELVPQLESEPEVEQIGEAPEDVPFAIPEKWKWCNFGNVVAYGKCEQVLSQNIEKSAWILDLEDIESGTGNLLQKKKGASVQSNKNRFKKGDVLYSKLRPYLNKVIVADEDGYCTTEIVPITPSVAQAPLDALYLKIYLMSPYFVGYANRCSYGVKMPRLGTKDAKKALFPVPPIKEQYRIVQRLNELILEIDKAESAYNELAGPLSDRLRQLLLERAIQGKLVPQLESEPEVKQIGEAPEDVPFAIPEKWKWLPLNKFSEKRRTVSPNTITGEVELWSIPAYDAGSPEKVNSKHIGSSKKEVVNGDVLLSKIVPNIKRAWIVKSDHPHKLASTEWLTFSGKNILDPEFMRQVFLSPYFRGKMMDTISGMGSLKRANPGILQQTLIPVPHLQEQRRIVAKLNELLGSISQLEQTISTP